jgi:uncharacterized protein YjbJ (UPF0337 family)
MDQIYLRMFNIELKIKNKISPSVRRDKEIHLTKEDMIMNNVNMADIVQGYWHEIKGKIKQQWGKLTDDDIQEMEGSQEELRGLLQKKYGYAKEKAEKEIDTFLQQGGYKNDKR